MQNNVIENIRLELNKPRVRTSVSVRTGDTTTRTLHITLTNNGSLYTLENSMVAVIFIEKPDGNVCYNDCIICGNEIQYTITSQSVNVTGECKCQVQVTFADGAVLTSPEFSIMVYEQVVRQADIISQNEYTSLTAQVVMAKDSAETAELSAVRAKESESIAVEAEANAAVSAQAAASSEANAATSAEAALQSETNATSSEQAAASSEANAIASAEAAASSEANALNSEQRAGDSAAEAKRYYEDLQASGQLVLGKEHNTAAYGDEGAAAYEHSLAEGNPHGTTYLQVGADKEGMAQAAYENAVAYTDKAIADLINGAPDIMDTLGEISEAMSENEDVVTALNEAISTKANETEFQTYVTKLEKLADIIGYPYTPS